MARSYDWGTIYSGKFAGQYLLADAKGDACVLGFVADGELAITRKPGGDGFIVSTNFNRAYPPSGSKGRSFESSQARRVSPRMAIKITGLDPF
jgi:hypothetical protein